MACKTNWPNELCLDITSLGLHELLVNSCQMLLIVSGVAGYETIHVDVCLLFMFLIYILYTAPEMYSKPNTTEQSYQDALIEERNGEDEEENDTLTVLEGSFETRRDLLRHKRDDRSARGLSFLADDIVDRFHKVAVSKHRVSSQEQTVIDDQFFRHSFVYPDFSSLNEGLQEFIAADLIDISLRNSLEKNSKKMFSVCVCVCVRARVCEKERVSVCVGVCMSVHVCVCINKYIQYMCVFLYVLCKIIATVQLLLVINCCIPVYCIVYMLHPHRTHISIQPVDCATQCIYTYSCI